MNIEGFKILLENANNICINIDDFIKITIYEFDKKIDFNATTSSKILFLGLYGTLNYNNKSTNIYVSKICNENYVKIYNDIINSNVRDIKWSPEISLDSTEEQVKSFLKLKLLW